MNCVNFSHVPTKPICLLVNGCPTTYKGNSSTCGTRGIVLHEVFPNFLTKYIICLFISVYGIDTSIESCRR